MATTTMQLSAGYFHSTGIRVMQIAGHFYDNVIRPICLYRISNIEEMDRSEGHTKDYVKTREFVFDDSNNLPGVPVLVTVHKHAHKKEPETVLIINVKTQEVIYHSYEGILPTIVINTSKVVFNKIKSFMSTFVKSYANHVETHRAIRASKTKSKKHPAAYEPSEFDEVFKSLHSLAAEVAPRNKSNDRYNKYKKACRVDSLRHARLLSEDFV